MATRGTLYRCHLFSYGGPQSEGIDSTWTQSLVPVGDQTVKSGEIVELFVSLGGTDIALDEETPIRFDILEEDFLLTGGLDDRVASLVGSGGHVSDEPFPVVQRRITRTMTLGPSDTPESSIARFVEDNPTDYADYLVMLTDPVDADSAFLVTWWKADFVDDAAGNSEFYFVLNLADGIDDQSQPVLNVGREVAKSGIPSEFPDTGVSIPDDADATGDQPDDDEDALPPQPARRDPRF